MAERILTSKVGVSFPAADVTNLHKIWIKLNRLCCICYSVPICLGLDVCLPKSVTRASSFKDQKVYLCSVRVIRRLLIIQLYRLGVEIDSGWPVVRSKGLVSLIFEGDGLLLWGRHGKTVGGEEVKMLLMAQTISPGFDEDTVGEYAWDLRSSFEREGRAGRTCWSWSWQADRQK